jgi:hypothetical protein
MPDKLTNLDSDSDIPQLKHFIHLATLAKSI